jgi:protein-disulfide isomerase
MRMSLPAGYAFLLAAGAVALAAAVIDHAAKNTSRHLPSPFTYRPLRGDLTSGASGQDVMVLVSLTCPHCAAWEREQLPSVQRLLTATGKVRLIMRDFPLDGTALKAAAYVRCLPANLRPEAHTKLMTSMSAWEFGGLAAVASSSGVNGDTARAAASCAADKKVQADVAEGAVEVNRDYGVMATPAFIIGNYEVAGGLTAAGIAGYLQKK